MGEMAIFTEKTACFTEFVTWVTYAVAYACTAVSQGN